MITQDPTQNFRTLPLPLGPTPGATTPPPGAAKTPTTPVHVQTKSAAAAPGVPANTQPAPAQPPAGTPAAPAQPPASNQQVLPNDPFSYDALQQLIANGGGGMNLSWITPEKWSAMTAQQKWQTMESAGGLPNEIQTPYGIRPTQGAVDAYTQQFGAPAGQLSVSYGPPTLFGHSAQEFLIDPSKLVQMPDGTYVFDDANVNQQLVNQWKQQDEHSGLDLTPAKGIGLVLGAAGIGDFLLGQGLGGASSLASTADTLTPGINDALDTSLMTPVGTPTFPDMVTPPDFAVPPPTIPGGGAPGSFSTVDIPPPMQTVPDPTLNTMTPTPSITTPGAGSLADRITNSLTRDPLRTVGTALTAGSLLGSHPSGVPPQATNTVNNNGPLQNQARDTLTNNGAPTNDQIAVIDATIEQQRRMGTEAILQAAANSGQGDKNSMVVQDKIRSFNEQLATMRMTMIQQQSEQNVLVALKELGMIDQETFQLAQLQLQQDTAQQHRIASIMQSLGWLWSGGGAGTTPASGTGST